MHYPRRLSRRAPKGGHRTSPGSPPGAILALPSPPGVDIAQIVGENMGIPSATVANHLIGSARQYAAELIEAFTAVSSDDEPVTEICTRASATFDTYCDGILNRLLSAVSPVDEDEIEWVRGHYLPLVIKFATAMRDSITDPICRHQAAQAIQCKILEHERHLRMVLDERAATATRSAGL